MNENVLTDKDLKKLEKLGVKIRACLSCNINDTGVPCRTDRLESIKLMQEYLLVHDIYSISYTSLVELQDKELNEIIEEKIKNRVNEEKK
tara:strand:- start:257 stop:526 length:270 start_codon:yes stop_codon:yes gene_type:complete